MFTRVGFHFLALIRVAGETRSLHLVHFLQIHVQRIVGVVARCAVFKCIMGMILGSVTAIAGRDGVFALRWMFLVTIRTANLCLMQSPPLDNVPRFVWMTLHTVIADQFDGMTFCPRKGAQKHYQWTNNNTDKNLLSHPCPYPPV
jgi:hypothetical protein